MQTLISVNEAEELTQKNLTVTPVEKVKLAQAYGRYLREDIVADRHLPPFDRVMMDGIAIKHNTYLAGNRTYPIAATQAAGAPAISLTDDRSCIEVMTGCVLPKGCDCVIPIELLDVLGGVVYLKQEANPAQGEHIHAMASDSQKGSTLLRSGQRLHAPELAIAASCGATALQVSTLPRIHIISTGDELVSPEETPQTHEIRQSHATALHATITGMHLGNVTQQHVADDPSALQSVFQDALTSHDILVITGGVSRGKYDYVAPVLEEMLGAPLFHGVAQRPGKPFAFWAQSSAEKKQTIFALPGNPVSVMACAARYLLPALIQIATGRPAPVSTLPATGSFNCPSHFTGLIPCRIKNGHIYLQSPSNSGNFLSLAGTHGIAELPGKLTRKDLLNQPATFYPWV